MNRIHIVGLAPRTGTTLIAQCMKRCFDIAASEPHEASLFECRSVSGIYLTKHPYDLRKTNLRMKMDRRLHVICMVRDPRDVITSIHGTRPGEYFVDLNVWKRNNEYLSKLSSLRNLTVIRYEDFLADPDGIQAIIEQRMPFLSRTQDFSKWHVGAVVSDRASVALNGARPIQNSDAFRWRAHAARIREQISAHGPISEDLVAWKYENDDLWMRELDSIQSGPSISNSRRPRRPILRRQIKDARYFISAFVCGACDRLRINYG